MSCPDINRLIDLLGDPQSDVELLAHLEGCPSCQAEYRLIQEIPAAFRPEIEVPEALVQRVMAGIPVSTSPQERPRVPAIQVLAAGVLGSLTAAAAILATGLGGTGGPLDLLLFSLGVGLVAGVVQSREGRLVRVDRV